MKPESSFLAKIVISLIIALYTFPLRSADIYLNEILSSNTRYLSGYTKSVDLIEIYNAGASAINLSGYFLSDNKLNPNKWPIPKGTTIAAKSYLVFYADERDSVLHTNFKLDIQGEFIGLYNASSAVVDSFTYKTQRNNISFGRSSSNHSEFGYFQTPSPGASNGNVSYKSMVEKPVFSLKGGFYASGQKLAITVPSGVTIRYTTDGRIPKESSTKYTDSITIDTTTCIRAAAYVSGQLTSNVVTHTYFINVNKNLPIVSLVTDPENFFSDTSGIYVIGKKGISDGCSSTRMNLNQDWERPVNIELFDENGINQINQGAGAKIFGGCSRQRYAIKSLALFARKEYGKSDFDYKLFKTKPITKFESFLLRSSSDDQQYTMFRDGLGHTLVKDLKVETQAFQHAVVYINGQYWGIQNIREKYNEAYFKENFDVDETNINLIENNSAVASNIKIGSATHYKNMLAYLKAHATDANIYEYMNTQMDIESFLDYMCSQIYLGADDWPGNNIRYWRSNTGRYSRWRWVCYDMDQVLMLNNSRWNSMLLATKPYSESWPNPSWSVELFKNMLKGKKFKQQFIQHIMFLMNTSFSTEHILEVVDSMQNNIINEMPDHIARWGGILVNDPNRASWILPVPETMELWEENVQVMRTFAIDRPDTAVNMLRRFFKLKDTVRLTITNNNISQGNIYNIYKRINSKEHQGVYFANTPFTIKAIPKLGYRFARWEVTPSNGKVEQIETPELVYTPTTNTNFKAIFEPSEITGPIVAINEINYHSSDYTEAGDWVEIFNRLDYPIDISGWQIKDGSEKHIYEMPWNKTLPGKSYLVICEDTALFKEKFFYTTNKLGDLGYSLSNGGEVIRLFDANGSLIDSVSYTDASPWPLLADGEGRSLSLLTPDLDNDLPINWSDMCNLTPGDTNVIGDLLLPARPVDVQDMQILTQNLYQNYPNPCKLSTTIAYRLSSNANVSLIIYDVYGRQIKQLVNNYQTKDVYKVSCDVNKLSKGLYYYSLRINQQLAGTKMMMVTK